MKEFKLHIPEETITIKPEWQWKPEPIENGWIYYYRRGNKCFFRHKTIGMKISIISKSYLKLMRGEEYEIIFAW